MTKRLIVESKNDQIFVNAVAKHHNLQIDDFYDMNGLSPEKLTTALDSLANNIEKKDIQSIGIILDHDGKEAERLEWVNNAIDAIFENKRQHIKSGDFTTVSFEVDPGVLLGLQISCYLMGVDNAGELETVLKAIHTQPATYANCLNNWRQCMEANDEPVSDKEFDKLWVNHYIRYDTCGKRERRQAAKNCSWNAFDRIMKEKAHIWDFDHEVLVDLRKYLTHFSGVEEE